MGCVLGDYVVDIIMLMTMKGGGDGPTQQNDEEEMLSSATVRVSRSVSD